MLITRDDIQRIGDENTLLHFLEEKLNLPIPEGAKLEQIARPWPLPFLGLADMIAEQIIDCQDFSGLPQDVLGERRPLLIRFRSERDYPEILRHVAEGLFHKNINPAEIFFICVDATFRLLAFAHFNNSDTEDWNAEMLNILIWTQKNTHINTGFEHDLSVLFSSEEEPSTEPDDPSKTEKTSSDYGGESNLSENLLIKLQNIRTPLGWYGDIHSGINLGYKDAFVIDDDTRKRLRDEYPNSADLIESFPDEPEKWRWQLRNVIYIPNSKNKERPPWPWSDSKDVLEAERIFKESYPAISAYMSYHKNSLKNAANSAEFYWEFPSRKILRKLEVPKIIYRTAHTSMQAAYDTSHRFLTSATHFIPTTDLSLLAILNSKFFGWFAQRKYKSSNPKIKQLSFSKRNMKKAPIAPRTEEQKAALSDLVQQILNDPNSQVPNIEREIDELVYKLYELTAAEIALIEEESNQ